MQCQIIYKFITRFILLINIFICNQASDVVEIGKLGKQLCVDRFRSRFIYSRKNGKLQTRRFSIFRLVTKKILYLYESHTNTHPSTILLCLLTSAVIILSKLFPIFPYQFTCLSVVKLVCFKMLQTISFLRKIE